MFSFKIFFIEWNNRRNLKKVEMKLNKMGFASFYLFIRCLIWVVFFIFFLIFLAVASLDRNEAGMYKLEDN